MTYDDDRLAALLSDAVSDLEPADRLADIRSRTKVVPMSSRRPWLYAVGGAVVATAATITAIAYAGHLRDTSADTGPSGHGGGHSGRPVHSSAPSDPASGPETGGPTMSPPVVPSATGTTYAVYYVGDGPGKRGPVLFREFHRGAGDKVELALKDLGGGALDGDYRSVWAEGDLTGASLDGDVIDVDVDARVHDRPAGMSQAEAEASVEQVIYTVQAAFGTRAPVQFRLNGNPVDQVLGVPTSEPLSQGKLTDTLSLMSISSPNEGDVISGNSLTVTGANNGFEGSAVVKLMSGDRMVQHKSTIGGWGGDKLYPWTVTFDVSGLAPGTYTIVASNDDPSGGEGNGPDVDTRVISIG